MNKVTESESNHQSLEKMTTAQLIAAINQEDQKVAKAVAEAKPQIEALIDSVYEKMKNGGRLFYMGSGTSGRLGILDASECPPTFGVGFDWVIGLIAGGDAAIRRAQENAEDHTSQGWLDLQEYNIGKLDTVVGLSASGTTPYVLGALDHCQKNGISTACIVCNLDSPIAEKSDFPIEIVVGPEFVTGSTRMKSGTAQKLALNMISTAVMIKLGRVKGNRMIDMSISNDKLVDRGVRMILDQHDIDYETAKAELLQEGSVRAVLKKLG